jgi:heptosyltransferase-1
MRVLALQREVRRFVGSLRSGRYDLVLDMQGLWKSALWSYASGSMERIGLDSREGSQRLMTRVVRSVRNDRQLGSEYKALLRDLGISPHGYVLGLETSEEDRAAAQRWIRERIGGRYLVFAPFTTREQKHWFEARWAELGTRVMERLGMRCAMIGGPGDADAAARIEARAPGCVVNLAGLTTLRQSLALIQEAQGMVGVDTGLTHMGVLSRIPTVALFGATRPYLDTDNPAAAVLYREYPCSPCRRRPVCGGEFPCMREHGVDTVLESLLSRLSP